MNIEDLILENLYEDDESVEINEDVMPITPFIAYAAFKKNTFGKMKDKFSDAKAKVGEWGTRKKATALIKKEKARAATGKTTGKGDDATVYKLTKEQMNVMADVYRKHGKKIVKDILEFRKNILAPYSLIKRKVKEASRVTNTDKFGMTKSEFKVYVESGRRKIESRGDKFAEKSEDLRDRLDRISDQIDMLRDAKDKIDEGKFPSSVLNRLYRDFKVHDSDLLGYSAEELRRIKDKAEKDSKELQKAVENIESGEGGIKEIDKIIELGSNERIEKDIPSDSKSDNKEDDKKEKEKRRGSFNIAYGRYLFRKEILDSLHSENSNMFKDAYGKIIDEMIQSLNLKRKDAIRHLRSFDKYIELNDKEKRIWKKRPTASKFSNDLNDYYQAIKEEDFLETPIYLERTPELKEAEQKIENEIRRFERSLEKKIGKEDFQKLKRYRLINNLITMRDLKSPKELFKDTTELLKDTNSDRDDISRSENYVSPEDFEKRVWYIHNKDFSSISEMNSAKKEVNDLVRRMKKQGDVNIVEKLERIINRINIRRDIHKERATPGSGGRGYVVDIDDIQKKAENILGKTYEDDKEKQRDMNTLKDMIKVFRQDNKERAEDQLARINNLLDKLEIN